jgi:hypothetical protein
MNKLLVSTAALSLFLSVGCAPPNTTPSPAPAPTPVIATYTVGGTISGMNGTLELSNNGADLLSTINNGVYTFETALNNGAAYLVEVATNPLGQTCTVSSSSGNISAADVSNVNVVCEDSCQSMVGTWDLIFDWSCDTITLDTLISFEEDGSFTTDGGGEGMWMQDACAVEWYFDGGAHYEGSMALDGESMEGDFDHPAPAFGCWTAFLQ